MTASEMVKMNGFKSLVRFSLIVDVPVSTLKDWHINRPKTFNVLMVGAKILKR